MKVWILEKFETPESMIKSLKHYEQMLIDNKDNVDYANMFEDLIYKQRELIKENPEGRWFGFEGKTNYHQFCRIAKDAIRRADKDCKFRVVEGEIRDDAQYWLGYKLIKVNDGVLKYLMATK